MFDFGLQNATFHCMVFRCGCFYCNDPDLGCWIYCYPLHPALRQMVRVPGQSPGSDRSQRAV
jgi:hypothetical protein